MSHMSFQPRGAEVTADADYIVIGSGAGGAAAAVTLARAGAGVLIVEAGPWRDPEDYASSTYGALRDMMDDWGSTITMGRALWPVVQARLVGGTTVINSAICVRTPADIFEEWQQGHGVGAPAYAERIWAWQDMLESELCVAETGPEAMGRSNQLALKGDAAAGYDGHVIKRYAKGCVGSGQCLQGCRSMKKQSTNLNYVPETLMRGGSILSCAPVDKILFDGSKAIGVTGRFLHPQTRAKGAPFSARAKLGVIVAASATWSPVILRQSGLTHKAVGAGFRSHPGTGVFGVYDEPVDMNTGVTQGWASTRFRKDPGLKLETLSIPMEMAISRLAGGGRALMERIAGYRHIAMWVHALRARSVGRVDVGWTGRPVVRFGLDEADMRRFREGMWRVAQLHFAAGAREVIPGIVGLPYSLGPKEVDAIATGPLDPRNYVAILSHLFGGCTMGADPSRSVCDGDGRVHGRDRLWVADASLMPDNIGVNPQHTIMAMAMEVATGALRGGPCP
ncbi:MAG: GMC family oxidoreductase [Myxococcales bacterium]|nr:GMC family oxidoreductase [Myxococcales bacterium]